MPKKFSEQFKDAIKPTETVARLFGFLTDEEYNQWNYKNRFIICCDLFSGLMIINGIFQVWPNYLEMISSIATLIIGGRLIGTLVQSLRSNSCNDYKNIVKAIQKFYDDNQENLDFHGKLQKSVDRTKIYVKVSMAIYYTLFNTPLATACIMSLIYGDFIEFIPFRLPFVDHRTLFGFILNISVLTLLCFVALAVLMLDDIRSMVEGLHYTPMIDILCLKMEKLGKDLNLREASKESKAEEIFELDEKVLVSIVEEFRTCNDYVKVVRENHAIESAISLTLNSLSIGLSLVIIFKVSIFIGLSFALLFFFGISFPCIIGTSIQIQNENFLTSLNELPWYLMSRENQKIYLQCIHLAQHPTVYRIPIIRDMNMELYKDVLYASYSYMMALMKFK